MRNISSEPELILSFERIKDVFFSKWKVLMYTVIASLIVATISSVYNYVTSGSSKGKYYEATSKVYIDWDESISSAFRSLDDNASTEESWAAYVESNQNLVSIYIQQWQKSKMNSVINDCNNFLTSNQVEEQINTALEDNGYEKYNGADVIKMTSTGTSHLFTVSVIGYENEDRVQFLTETITNIIIENGQNLLGLGECRIIDNPDSYQVFKSGSGSKSVYSRAMYYPDNSAKSISENNSLWNIIFSKSNVIIVLSGGLLGFAIILIFIFKDRNIREQKEIEALVNIPYFGDKDKLELNILVATIISKCKASNIHHILLTTINDTTQKTDSYLTVLISMIMAECDDINITLATDFNNNEVAVRKINDIDTVLLAVEKGRSDKKSFKDVVNRISVVDGKVLGYIFC